MLGGGSSGGSAASVEGAAQAKSAISQAAAEAASSSSSATSTLESLSDLYIRALYVCRIGSQTAFALSPIAAYLPQYLAMQTEASHHPHHGPHFSQGQGSANGDATNSAGARGRENSANSPNGGGGGGGGSMHRRTRSKSPIGLSSASSSAAAPHPPKTAGLHASNAGMPKTPPRPSSPSSGNSSYEYSNSSGDLNYNNNGGIGGGGGGAFFSPPDATIGRSTSAVGQSDGKSGDGGGGGGMSPISMLILLLSHLFRLLYFYGHHVWLPASDFEQSSDEGEKVQYDLVVQSLVMVGFQLLLVRATARIRLAKAKRRLSDHDHSDATRLGGLVCVRGGFESCTSSSSSNHHRQKRPGRFCKRFCELCPTDSVVAALKSLVARIVYVLHPQRVWRYNTLREHVEFLSIFMLVVCIYCRLSLFPTFGGGGVDRIRNISVLLESCLALPQVVQNYYRRDTAGLSVVMIVGWIMGDWMKLLYFLLQSPGGGDTASDAAVAAVGVPVAQTAAAAVAGAAVPGAGDSSGATLRIFAAGCIVALTLDVWVLLQLVVWYPTRQMKAMRAKVGETWDRFKPHDAAGRKRAVAKEMIRELFGWTDSRHSPPKRKNTDDSIRSIQVADGNSNWS